MKITFHNVVSKQSLARGLDLLGLHTALGVCLLLVFSAIASAGQAEPPKGQSDKREAGAALDLAQSGAPISKAVSPKSDSGEIIYLPGPNGKLVPLPPDATLKDYLKWRKAQIATDRNKSPQASVTSIALEGKVDDGRATLTAHIKVQIHLDDAWVRVPLGLNEGILRQTAYKGVGEASFDGFQRENGYRWWFHGKGLHNLTLSITVAVLKQGPTRRLQLTIPTTAVSQLKLQVPLQRVSLKPLEHSAVKTKPIGKTASQIEVFGLGKRLDLQWQSLPSQKRVATVLRAQTSITVGLTGESVLLEASQKLEALQGSFEEVSLQLPTGFELLKVEEKQAQLYSNHIIDPAKPNRVTVKLTEPTTGPLELKWTLQSRFPPDGGPLILDGFEVESARRQTGEIAIKTVEGYRVRKRRGEDRYVYRINVSELVGEGNILSAYRFLKQPFRLVLDLQEIEPYFTAEAHQFLRLSAERAELEARFRFQVYRGAIQDLELKWPAWEAEGWVIEPMESPGLVERVDIDKQSGKGSIRIRLVERTHGRFELSLKAHRELTRSEHAFDFSLPLASASSRLPTILVVANADNIEANPLPQKGTSARPLPAQMRDALELPEELRGLRRSEFRIDSSAHAFSTNLTVQERLIRTETTAKVELDENRLLVIQRISYEVAYERLAQVRLLIPRDLEGRVEFHTGKDALLSPNWTGVELGTLKQARFMLTEPRLGRFEILARFFIDLSEDFSPGQEVEAHLLLIQSSDAEYSAVRFEFETRDQIAASLPDESWKRQLSGDNSTVWLRGGTTAEIPLKLKHSTIHPSQDYSVRKALVRTVFDQQGYARSRAQYLIDGKVSGVVLLLPEEIAVENFWWDQQKLETAQIEQTESGSGEYRLQVAKALDRGKHLLTVDFHSQTTSPFSYSDQHTITGPQFPSNVWVEQTIWQLVLPFDQQLFTNPLGFTPQYRWKRETFFWRRFPLPEYADLSAWIGAGLDGPADRSESPQGNSYLFSRFGPTASIAFGSMSQSIVVLFGAGLALSIGFVLLKIPVTRNVLTLLTVAFALALAGLWHAAPVQLLLQPAILGLLLAIVAAVIEGSLKRQRTTSILTLSSPSDFITPAPSSSSVDRPLAFGVGSEDPTTVRPAPQRASEAISSSEAGSNA